MQTEYLVVIPLVLQIIGLLYVVFIDRYIKKVQKNILMIIGLMIFSLLIRDLIAHMIDLIGTMPYERTLLAIFGYILRPILIVMYIYVVRPEGKHTATWILTGLNALVYLTALFSDICFTIDENNQFHRGPLGYTAHIVSVILLLYTLWLSINSYSAARKTENIIPIVISISVLVALIFDSIVDYRDYPVTFITIVLAGAGIFYYIWLHLQFVREHEQALMAEQRIKIMISQIQPHFLYNTLSTIQALCRTDPEKAFVITERFGTYLRQNIDSLSQANLIPVTKELEHTKIYAEIEMVRFGNITVEYDTPEMDFSVPALTIQPLVENAIRHGVRIREKGIVKVSTAKTANGYEIVIEDNGTGFDAAQAEQADETHIGLKNVRERIQSMCGGTLKIDSSENTGTKITISVPLQIKKF